jgi:hypothetical protein
VPSAAEGRSAAGATVGSGQEQQEIEVQPDGKDYDLSIETCPAAVGARWLPNLMQHLNPARISGGGMQPSSGAGSAAAPSESHATPRPSAAPRPDGSLPLNGASLAPRRTPSSTSHRSLAEVRGLFDAAHADGGGRSG